MDIGNALDLEFTSFEKHNGVHNTPKKMNFDETITKFLKKEGISGFALVDFDYVNGPILRLYYTSETTSFIKKAVKNPAVIVELSIIGKYAREIITSENEHLLISKIPSKDRFGREVPQYLIIELKGRRKRVAKMIMEKVTSTKRVEDSIISTIKKLRRSK